jgi:hypothetical protein
MLFESVPERIAATFRYSFRNESKLRDDADIAEAVKHTGVIFDPRTAAGCQRRGDTMTSRRFFATVWRVNAIAILVTAVLACAVLAFAAWQIYKETVRTRHATGVVNVSNEEIDHSRLELGSFDDVAGTEVLRAPLQIEQSYGFGSGSKETSSVQNYLFYDPSDGSSHWLRPGNKGLFLSTRELPERKYSEPEKPVVAIVYELVEADTNGDRRLTESDDKTIAISDPIGSFFTTIIGGVEELNGTTLAKNGRVVVLYTANSTLKVAEIDVDTHKVIRDAPVRTIAPAKPATATQ